MPLFEQTSFATFTYRLLKTLHPDCGMTGESLSTMTNITKFQIRVLMEKVNRLRQTADLKTITAREIQAAVPFVYKGELAKYAISEAQKAVTKYNTTPPAPKTAGGAKNAPVSRGSRAGLTFPVTRIGKIMDELSTASRKSDSSAVYLTAVIEYVNGQILEQAGNMARDNNRVRILPRYITLPIAADAELAATFKNVIMSGGVLPMTKVENEKKAPAKKPVVKKKFAKKPTGKKPKLASKVKRANKGKTLKKAKGKNV